ncbi:MAG: SH3 domain-containing protein [Anaerolineales bacterium]
MHSAPKAPARHAARQIFSIAALAAVVLAIPAAVSTARAAEFSQPPTVSIPTVTGTPLGPMIVVPDQANVRSGPGTEYELIGVLIAGQRATALGRAVGGLWIQIIYPGVPGNVGWVYSPVVVLDPPGATLPIVEPPPTATPRATATIDPTLAAQFNLGEVTATRLPTFTPAGPVVQPTFAADAPESRSLIPPIVAIAGLVMVGTFGMLISILRGS